MSQRALVVVLGQLRAHELTWAPFKKHVIEQLNADLAVCVPDDAFFDFTNPYYLNARYRWVVPDPPDAADTFDRIQRLLGSSEDWRVLCDVRGAWLGRVRQANQPGSTALLFILRWFMLNNIEAAKLGEAYDRFIITRSDYFYLAPHPPIELLDSDSIWIPDGEDYGGICDRHLVVSPSDLAPSCNLLEEILCRPRQLREAMVARLDWDWTTERSLALHFSRSGLAAKIRRFPFVMFLVRGPSDPTTWSPGEYADEVNMLIKYRSELNEARRNERHLRSNTDWRRFFAASEFEHLFPARVYTNHGTIVYVAGDGELRHGPLEESPANLWFVRCGSDGLLVHRAGDRLLCGARVSEQGEIFFDLDDARTPSPMLFERVKVTGTNFVGLRSGGIYLRADPGKQVVLNQTYCRGCEHFRLIPDLHEADAQPSMTECAGLIAKSASATHAPRQEIPPANTFLHQLQRL
jgi:hypothetical protein